MTADTATSRSLACLEIWGGNCAVQEALELPGLSAWVSMLPDPGIAIPSLWEAVSFPAGMTADHLPGTAGF